MRDVLDIISTFVVVVFGWMIFYAPNIQFILEVTKGYFNFGMPYIHQTTIFFFGIRFAILLLKDIKDEYLTSIVQAFEHKNPQATIIINYLMFVLLIILILWFLCIGRKSVYLF